MRRLEDQQALRGTDRGPRAGRRHHCSLRPDAESQGARQDEPASSSRTRSGSHRASRTWWASSEETSSASSEAPSSRPRLTPPAASFDLTAVYIVVAPDPSRSLTIHVEGVQDNQSGTAVLDGRVVDGSLAGAHAHAEYKVISCTQSPDQTCFQGTISIKRRSEHSGD